MKPQPANPVTSVGVFIDRPTSPHTFSGNRAGQCSLCIFPKEHAIHSVPAPILTVWLESQDLDSLGTRHFYRIDCSEVSLFGHYCGEGELSISGIVDSPESDESFQNMFTDGVIDSQDFMGDIIFRHREGGPNSYAIAPLVLPTRFSTLTFLLDTNNI